MLKHRLYSLLNAIWAVPTVIAMRLIRPWRFVRVGHLFAGRIGHFVPDAIEHLLRKETTSSKTVDYFYLFGGIANSHWEKMVRRNLRIKGGWLKYVWHWNNFLPGGEAHTLPQSFTSSRDTEGLLEKSGSRFSFLVSENLECKKWLRSKGWKEGEPFVCLQVRDSAYLSEFDVANPGDREQLANSYRDSDINSYLRAIEWLTTQGVWVIRMGKLVKTPLPAISDRIIDYATDTTKSDELDIWLFANCMACISTASGPDWVSIVFGKPILFVNAIPLGGIFTFAHSMWIPKTLVWESNQVELSLVEILRTIEFQFTDYTENGIRICDLTSDEILDGVQEFWSWICDYRIESIEEKLRHQQFWQEFQSWERYPEFHGFIHAKSVVSNNWLSKRPSHFLK
jgi:putative glycosyltransferase (TIGR04372 family)